MYLYRVIDALCIVIVITLTGENTEEDRGTVSLYINIPVVVY